MCRKWLEKENRTLDSIASIATVFAIVGAVCIGIWQNQINKELVNISSKELISSKTPLVSIDLLSLKDDETSAFFIKEVKFSNKGIVPVTNIGYRISFSENSHSPALDQVLDGTLFQEESIVRKTIMNKFQLNEPVQLIVIKANFTSLFDPNKKYCVERTYTLQINNEHLDPLDLTEAPHECK